MQGSVERKLPGRRREAEPFGGSVCSSPSRGPRYTHQPTTSTAASQVGKSVARKASVLPAVYVLTQTEVGKSLGMSQRKVSCTIAVATKTLRSLLGTRR